MILVLVEVSPAGEPVETSLEAVTFARDLAAAGGGVPIDAVVVGAPGDDVVKALAAHGVRRVHALTGSAYDAFAGAAWAAGLLEVRERAGSVVVMAAGTPRGNPGRWATNDDYPARAMREEREGTTGFRVTYNAEGRVTSCDVTSSSGHADLDAETCKLIQRRGRFNPGKDRAGNPTGGSYSNRIRWQIPR